MTRAPVPWWPDTVSVGAIFGTLAVLIAVKVRTERETNRRLWNGLKTLVHRVSSNRHTTDDLHLRK
jgi:hypothetical protein